MSKSNAEKYNECNPEPNGYCMFEQQFKELQNKIEQLGINYAFEDLGELEEQLKEYKQLCIMKTRLEELQKNIDVSELDSITIDILNEITKITSLTGVRKNE